MNFFTTSSTLGLAFVVLCTFPLFGCQTYNLQKMHQPKKPEKSVMVQRTIHNNYSHNICANTTQEETLLYELKLGKSYVPELQGAQKNWYTEQGLVLNQPKSTVKLNKFYSLAERKIRYKVSFSSDAVAEFKSSQEDFKLKVDVPNKTISLATNPRVQKKVPFLQANSVYYIEIYHIYQQAIIRIIDVQTNQLTQLSVTNDGQGGCGAGAIKKGFSVGMQWDYYCFGLQEGSFLLVKELSVLSLKRNVRLLIYGDSISQPEGYYPTEAFPYSWTQMVIRSLNNDAISAGRGGGNIHMLLESIRNELPFIHARYVMVTIGTNGGNTEQNLTELITYIRSQGSIPILNNIPCNESGTHIEVNKLTNKIRIRNHLKGCAFDLATSLKGDGKEVDKSLMFWEDYSNSYGWQIYHHPNEKGSKKMFDRLRIDVPEIFM